MVVYAGDIFFPRQGLAALYDISGLCSGSF